MALMRPLLKRMGRLRYLSLVGLLILGPMTNEEKYVLNEATQAALAWSFTGPAPNIFSAR